MSDFFNSVPVPEVVTRATSASSASIAEATSLTLITFFTGLDTALTTLNVV